MSIKPVGWLIATLALVAAAATGNPDARVPKGTIAGTVRDAASGEPLLGASGVLAGGFGGTQADTSGAFSLRLPAGEYALRVSHVGYHSAVAENIELGPSDTVPLQIALQERPVLIEGITVTPGRFNIMGTEPTARQSLTQDQTATMPQLGDDFFRAIDRRIVRAELLIRIGGRSAGAELARESVP